MLWAFRAGSDGANPYGGLLLLSNTLTGTTYYGGGSANYGTVFRVDTSGDNYQVLKRFTGGTDGQFPLAGLVAGGGALYGTTFDGGGADCGTIFALNLDGTGYEQVKCFSAGDGTGPAAALTLAGDTLYGVTQFGGSPVFKVNTNGTGYTPLIGLGNVYSTTDLVLAGGVLYGTTELGGSANNGMVFRVDTNGGNYQVLKTFTGGADGGQPCAGLVLTGGVLYGTTAAGGTSNLGTVFRLHTNGTAFAVLRNFAGGADGAQPLARLALAGGTLYGTTYKGGACGSGTVFSLKVDGTGYSVLKTFAGGADGAQPQAWLVVSDSSLYGTTDGGSSSYGNVFRLDGGPPVILQPPQGQTVLAGSSATLSVTLAPNAAATACQWVLDGTNALPGATGATLALTNLQAAQTGNYTVVVSNQFGALTSAVASLAVITTPIVETPPAGQIALWGASAWFSVAAIGPPPLVYQWCFDGTNALPGATNSTLTLTNLQASQAGVYTVVVSNQFGFATSAPAGLVVVTSPLIQTPPTSQSVPYGGVAQFSVGAIGPPALGFQWYFNGAGALTGATNPVLTLTNLQSAQAGNYVVVVTDQFGAATSAPAVLAVVDHSTVGACTEAALRSAMGPGGRVCFACDGTIPLAQAFTVTNNLVLDGAGHTVVLSGNGSTRLFSVSAGASLTLSNLTLANGSSADGLGGGAILNHGTLTVGACTFQGNQVVGLPGVGSGSPGGDAQGGAIYNSSAGTLSLTGTTFLGNGVTGGNGVQGANGGAPWPNPPPSWLDGTPGGAGGGAFGSVLYNSGRASLVNCTATANSAIGGSGATGGNAGSGLYEGDGWAQYRYGSPGGGGVGGAATATVYDASGNAALTNCTLAANSATGGVGGAAGLPEGSSLSPGGTAQSGVWGARMANCLLAGNPPGDTFTDGGHNLVLSTTKGVVGPLADNGGPTWTMALPVGSPAIDAADPATAPAADQRGLPRPSGLSADVGAFEFQFPWPPAIQAGLSLNGSLNLNALGSPNRWLALLTSTNLVDWTPLSTNQLSRQGTLAWQITVTGEPHRYFRLLPQLPWPPVLRVAASPTGGLAFTAYGTPGASARLLSSTDLTSWTQVSTIQLGADGSLTLHLPAGSDPHRFFRLVAP